MNHSDSIFFVTQYKGGAGKTTTASQIIAPFLFEELNGKDGLDSSKSIKPKYYEIDEKNYSKELFESSEIIDSELIKDANEGFQRLLEKELSDYNREYPIIFDVGVGYVKEAIKTFMTTISDEKVFFVVPFKQSMADYNNAMGTINHIKELKKDANIILVLSDAKSSFNEKKIENEPTYLEEEFGIAFGNYYNFKANSFSKPIFSATNIEEKYISLLTSNLFNICGYSFKTTIYEAAKHGKVLGKVGVNHPLEKAKSKNKELQIKSKAGDERNKLIAENKIINYQINFYKRCYEYYKENLEPIYLAFGKIL